MELELNYKDNGNVVKGVGRLLHGLNHYKYEPLSFKCIFQLKLSSTNSIKPWNYIVIFNYN